MTFSKSVMTLLWVSLLGLLPACTEVDSPKSRPVQYGGSCSQEYSKDYERLLNWPTGTDNKAICDEFYIKYPNVKCFSQVNGTELRVHTSDFDEACGRRPGSKSKKPTEVVPPAPGETTRTQGLCTPELTLFIIEKKKEFQGKLIDISTNEPDDANLFSAALEKRKICNQFFHSYKYSVCHRDNTDYSYHDLKPYCDEFQSILHKLRVKNPKKFSPEELKPLVGLNLKFHFQDSLVSFFSSKAKIKDSYIADGLSIKFADITSSQSYCFFESESIRFAGELKNEIYKIDISATNKNRFTFSHTSFNENWKMVCHFPEHFYFQDLIEVVGDTVSIFE